MGSLAYKGTGPLTRRRSSSLEDPASLLSLALSSQGQRPSPMKGKNKPPLPSSSRSRQQDSPQAFESGRPETPPDLRKELAKVIPPLKLENLRIPPEPNSLSLSPSSLSLRKASPPSGASIPAASTTGAFAVSLANSTPSPPVSDAFPRPAPVRTAETDESNGRPERLSIDMPMPCLDLLVSMQTPVNAQRAEDDTTALHAAVAAGNTKEVLRLLTAGGGEKETKEKDGQGRRAYINSQDEHGYSPLMVAAASTSDEIGRDLCSLLLSHGASIKTKDKDGFNCLHWGAGVGNPRVCQYLVKEGGMPVDGRSKGVGETPLHRAARFGHLETIETLVDELGASVLAYNAEGMTAYEVAGRFNDHIDHAQRFEVQELLVTLRPSLRSVVLYHEDALLHATLKGHQEAPERVEVIMRSVEEELQANKEGRTDKRLDVLSEFPKATQEILRLAHSKNYVDFVYKLAEKVATSGTSVPFTPRVQVSVHNTNPAEAKAAEICDTSFSPGSLTASLRAVGAVCRAVDEVVKKKRRNAFCCVRPPGHHAGREGLLQGCISCGFCIFNGVAVGALHALQQHPESVQKVAIVDFDVHHGNGTEDIVKHVAKSDSLFFSSIHLYDKMFYPGSGRNDSLEFNALNIPLRPLWENSKDREGGRRGFRKEISSRLLPALRAFNPDLILISAGFDGAKNDVGNKRHGNRLGQVGLDLLPHDYAWITEQLQRIANFCCQGRIVSVLEGGYGEFLKDSLLKRTSLATNALAHIKTLVGDIVVEAKEKKESGRTSRTSSPSNRSAGKSSPTNKKTEKTVGEDSLSSAPPSPSTESHPSSPSRVTRATRSSKRRKKDGEEEKRKEDDEGTDSLSDSSQMRKSEGDDSSSGSTRQAKRQRKALQRFGQEGKATEVKPPIPKKKKDSGKRRVAEDKAAKEKEEELSDGDGELYEVEKIVKVRVKDGRQEFLVKWKGYSDRESTWETKELLEEDCPEYLLEFLQGMKGSR